MRFLELMILSVLVSVVTGAQSTEKIDYCQEMWDRKRLDNIVKVGNEWTGYYPIFREGEVQVSLKTKKINGICVPDKLTSKFPRESWEMEWSLEDCYNVQDGISANDLLKCMATERKIRGVLKKDFETAAKEYGFRSRNISPSELVVLIQERCGTMRPLTNKILKDPAVIKFFAEKNKKIPAQTPSIQSEAVK